MSTLPLTFLPGARRLALVALVGGIAALSGCSSFEAAKNPEGIAHDIDGDASIARHKQVEKRLFIAPVRVQAAFNLKAAGALNTTTTADASGKTSSPAAGEGAAPAGGATPAPAGGEGAAPASTTPAPAGGAAPAPAGEQAPTGKQGAYRFRRMRDGAMVAAFYREPLYREVLFSPQGNGQGDSAPTIKPSPGAQAGDVIEYLCPRCNRTVSENDPFCRDCGLAFSPESKPVVPVPAPRPSPDGPGPIPPTNLTGTEPAPKPPAPAPNPFEKWVCYVDGEPVAADQEYCPRCHEYLMLPNTKIRVFDGGTEGPQKDVTDGYDKAITYSENHDQVTIIPDTNDLQDTIAQTIRAYDIFKGVSTTAVVAWKDLAVRNDTEAAINAALAGDKDGSFDFVMIPTIRQWQTSYLGRNGAWWGSMGIWVLIGEPLPNAWIRGEMYRTDIAMDFELYHVRSGQKISTQRGWTDRITASVEQSVDQWDRGWYPWSIVAVPMTSSRWESGWRNLDANLAPLALNQIQQKLLKEQLYIQFGEHDWEEIEAKDAQVVALLLGCHAPRLSSLKLVQPSHDVEEMEKTLKEKLYLHNIVDKPSGNRYSKLVEQAASLENVQTWVRNVLPRLAPSDFCMIYFSGFGAIEQVSDDDKTYTGKDRHEKYILLSDSDPTDLKRTGLSLSWLQEQISRAKCKNFLVALDCSFAADAEDNSLGLGRSFPVNSEKIMTNVPNKNDRKAALKQVLRSRTLQLFDSLGGYAQLGDKSCQLMLAADQDQAAMEYERLGGAGQGLFTYFLSKGIGGLADADKNGNVQMSELDNYVKREVGRIANVAYGLPQDVMILGRQNMSYVVPLMKLKATAEREAKEEAAKAAKAAKSS